MHQAMAAALDKAFEQISAIQAAARDAKGREIPAWPMIVLRSPKGGTGPISLI